MAQTATWNAPASGFVVDRQTHSIRTVNGFLGAAHLGPSLIENLEWASIAPNQKSALVARDGVVSWLSDLAAPDQAGHFGAVTPGPQVLWAADSSRAVTLVNSSKLAFFTLPGSSDADLSADTTWDLSGLPTQTAPDEDPAWSVLAADANADKVLLRSKAGDQWFLWLASRNTPPAPLAFTGHPVAAVFAGNSSSVFVAESTAHQIVLIQNLDNAPASSPVLTSEEYLKDPAGLALSADGTRIFAADRSTANVRVFNAVTGDLLAELEGDALPDSLTSIAPGRFLLNPTSGSPQPLFILDIREPARVLFVPRGE